MNKHLKTLLLVSAISLPISACSHFHGKTDNVAAAGGKNCQIMKNLDKAKVNADNVLKELDEAAANTTDAKTKKRIQKLIKETDTLSSNISKSKKACDVKADDAKAPVAKKKHKKAKADATVAPAAAAEAPAKDKK